MTRDEHKQAINQLIGMISAEHQADASLILTNLSEDYEETLTASETTASALEKANEKNNRLRDVNSELLLKVGVTRKEAHIEDKSQPTITEDKPLPFSDLFNEKGELI